MATSENILDTAIRIENIWKEYRLGVIGHGTLTRDLQSWWARVRGRDDPNSKISLLLKGQEKQIEGDRFLALRGIDLEVKQGEILGVVGKNGAGKSTLLKILSRVTAPTRGSIRVKGRIASLLEVGTGFHPELTGRENIFLNGAILGMSKHEIRAKFDEIVDFSGVADFIDTPVKRYSSGMYVRLAFAVAAHLEPEILVIDEVLAVGDVEFQQKCLGKMEAVGRQGRTILFVSHNLPMIEKLCPQSVLLRDGKVSGYGDTQTVLGQYKKSIVHKTRSMELEKYEDRQGIGELKFTRIQYLDEAMAPLETAKVGAPLTIRLHFKNITETVKKMARFSVGISNFSNDLINLDTSVSDGRSLSIRGDGYLDFLVNRLPLTAGSYLLSVFAEANGDIQDWIKEGPTLEVVDGNFFTSGRNCVQGFETKQVIVDHTVEYSWKM